MNWDEGNRDGVEDLCVDLKAKIMGQKEAK